MVRQSYMGLLHHFFSEGKWNHQLFDSAVRRKGVPAVQESPVMDKLVRVLFPRKGLRSGHLNTLVQRLVLLLFCRISLLVMP